MKILSPTSKLLEHIPEEILGLAPELSLVDLQDTTKAGFPTNAIYVTGTLEPKELVEQVLDRKLSGVLQSNDRFFHDDLKRLVRLRENPRGYFENQIAFLFPDAKAQLKLDFTSADDKTKVRDECINFCKTTNSRNVEDSIAAIFEELYMNAMMDAPNEAAKKTKSAPATGKDVKAQFCMVRSEKQMGISCSDPYGSLDCEKFLVRLREIYQHGAGQVINLRNEGGAGIGCSLMFENASSIILGVMPGKQTLVSCIIPLGLSNRQRAEIKKSLHLVQL